MKGTKVPLRNRTVNYNGGALVGPPGLDQCCLFVCLGCNGLSVGQLAVVHGPCASLSKHEVNMSSAMLASGPFIFHSLLHLRSCRRNVLLW